MPKKLKPIRQDPIEVVQLQFDAGPDAPKDKKYTSAQIFEAKQKASKKASHLLWERKQRRIKERSEE